MKANGVVAVLAALTVAGLPASIAIAAGSPTASVTAVLGAARSEKSVHYVSTGGEGNVHVTQIADVGERSGVQRITVRVGTSSGQVTVIVDGGNAYLRASNVFVLVAYLGFNQQAAARYVGRWVLIPPYDAAFATVAAAVTLPTTIDEVSLSKPITRSAATTKDGKRVNAFNGKTPKILGKPLNSTLYARATGTPLPVEDTVHQGNVKSTLTFSKWNEPLTEVSAPGGATPISQTGLEPAGQIA